MTRAHRRQRVRGRRREPHDDRRADHRETGPPRHRHEERTCDPEPEDQHCGTQRRAPVRRATEQVVRPHRRRRDGDRQHHAREPAVAVLPHHRATDADERADRGNEGNCVVLVDDALAEADRHARHEQPPTPEDQCGARAVGPGPAQREHESADEEDERGGDQPRRLPAEAVVEQPRPAGRAPLTALPARARRRHRRRCRSRCR